MFRRIILSLFFALPTSMASAHALYTLIPPTSSSEIGCWEAHFSRYDSIVGYSNLGHFFLRASANNEYIVLHPFKKAAKSYGVFPTVADFEKQVLKDAGFTEYVLRADHMFAIQRRLGALKKNEIYIPQPYPLIGGSDKPETYSKGNVWVFMDIVAQMQGICD